MGFEDQGDFAAQVADLNRYGQALNSCESVDEVVSLTLEAMSLLFEYPYSTFVEVRNGVPEVSESMNPHLEAGDEPSGVVLEAIETGETVRRTGADAGLTADSSVKAELAVPASIVDDVIAVLVMRATAIEEIDNGHAEPLEILASHAATAISNIRSREELERARNDLETRKEMVEMYDRLLRHDLGNDLQVITGFADVVADQVDGETREYVERIERSAESASDLIGRVGDLVSTLEEATEPEPKSLRAELEETVRDVDSQYDGLTVEFDPDAFACQVYGGDLLDSVFTNILSNAAIHNDDPVTVSIYVEEPTPETVIVGFADDGSGVPEEIRDDIFEMGRKGPESTGTGLGLGFVRALTESYGGTVDVRESAAGGADFRVRLDRV
ncbi:histidine kinase [Halorhabdus sp. CBA1104]|uniref:GAF domain-containing sensor histidine kinase n=1 Tax=unclassified Halorhabdus TaxID=2621901 RepID=UPI0012B28D1B|nr:MULTISPECIES: ATP-binding protein [unclassified Halorhabdus]QGN06692.1 histidine kinase [Halorhabdus sp. CBA1104]